MDNEKLKERRAAKALKRSQRNQPTRPLEPRTEAGVLRLERYKRRQILFRKFKL